MRPSSSLLCEPGAEQGIPQGRDLFTFVTSAASHMMRTLQRPRKSRPSKRQVNHRRFLHNMIHRKFAEIEAANQQLSSAIYSREGEGTQASSPIYVSSDQSDDAPGEESLADKLPPTLSSASTSLSLPLFSPDNTMLSNQQEEPNSLWTFNLHLESPQETTDLPYCQTFGTETRHTGTEASQFTFQRGNWGSTEEERCPKWCSFDTCGQSLDSHPSGIDSVMKQADNIWDENGSAHVRNAKIRNSPESDPNQQYNAASLTPDIHALNFNPTPTPPFEPQSLSSCAFGFPTAAKSHCSLTDMSNIQENISDSFYLIDSGIREGEGCREPLAPAESVWAPPSQDCEIQSGDTFLNADSEMSNYRANDLIYRQKASDRQNTGMRSFNGTNRSDQDYPPASFPHLDAPDQPRANDGRESVDAVRDLGFRDSWLSDPTGASTTKTPVLSSGTGGTFSKNYMTGYDSSSITGPDFLSLVYGSQGDSQCTLGGGEWQESGPKVQFMVSSACLNPPLALDSVDQSSLSSRCHFVPPHPTSSPNSCSPASSCMRGGGYQNHSPFMDVAKFPSHVVQKPHACQILTPPLEDYWLFDNILGEHETRRI